MAEAKAAQKVAGGKARGLSCPPPPPSETELTVNALKVLERRYLKKGDDGRAIERPNEMFWRVAWTIASVDKQYEKDADVMSTAKEFYHLMMNMEFMPN